MQWCMRWGQATTYGSRSSVLTMWVVGIKLQSFTSWPISGAPLQLLKRWNGKGFEKISIPFTTSQRQLPLRLEQISLESPALQAQEHLISNGRSLCSISTCLLMEAHIKIYENILFPILCIVVHQLNFGGSTSYHFGGVRDRASFISIRLQH